VLRLPFSLKVLLENLLRREDGVASTREHIEACSPGADAKPRRTRDPVHAGARAAPGLHGRARVVDLAAMRDAMRALGGDPTRSTRSAADLVIDHSVQVDYFGTRDAFARNVELEFARNRERYAFLRWGQQAFRNFRSSRPTPASSTR
jgi:aconitate hydratase